MSVHIDPSIEQSIREICQTHGASLLEIVLRGTAQRRIVEIYVDNEEGITLDTCGVLNREISDLLEQEQTFTGNWRLDVSSPGIDRPLEHPWQYRKNKGRLLSVVRTDGTTLTGRLKDVGASSIILELVSKPKREHIETELPLDTVKSATVQIEW